MQKISLLPIGEIEKPVLEFLAGEMKKRFVPEIEQSPAIEVPQSAFNPSRNKYHSTMILEELKKLTGDFEKLLGIIDADLYVPRFNFVLGESILYGRAAIISLIRLREEFYGLKRNQELFYDRALKEAIHELGHTYGVSHCENPYCVMTFSNSIDDTDNKGSDFCDTCRNLIRERNPSPVLKES